MRRIPEYRVVEVAYRFVVEDEYDERPTDIGHDFYHQALLEAAELTSKAIDEYDPTPE